METELYKQINETEKVLFILYDKPKLTRKTLSANMCHPVTSVTSVTSVPKKVCGSDGGTSISPAQGGHSLRGDNGDQGDNGDRVTAQSTYVNLKKYLSRLLKKKLVKRDESSQPYIYSLTIKGEEYVELKYRNYKKEINAFIKRENDKTHYEFLIDQWSDYFNCYEDLINQSLKGFIKIDLQVMALEFPYLVEQLYDDPENTLNLGKVVLDGLDMVNNKAKIIFYNAHSSIYRNITKIRSEDIDKLVNVVGEIRSRGQTRVTVKSALFKCSACGERMTVLQFGQRFIKPRSCDNCSAKNTLRLVKKEVVDSLKIVVNDLYENLTTNEVPEEINVFLNEDVFGFSKLNEGDRVRLIAIPKLLPVANRDGSQSIEEMKVLECFGIDKLEEDFDNTVITQEDEEQFKIISKDPLSWHKKILFHDLHDVELPSDVAVMSLYGSLNILFVGMPGCGKSVILRRMSGVALRGAFVDCTTSRPAGIIGAATKNPFTGKYGIDGGVFRPMHPGGISVLDEINRDNDRDIQKVVLGVMSNKKLNVHKANIKLDTDCDVSVWCSANPVNASEYVKLFDAFGVLHPLWDRFDLVVYFNNTLNTSDVALISGLIQGHKQKFELEHDLMLLLKKYQIRARSLNFYLSESDVSKLAGLLKLYAERIDSNASHRRIGTIKNLLECVCRLHHRSSPIDADFVFLKRIIEDISYSKKLFIQFFRCK